MSPQLDDIRVLTQDDEDEAGGKVRVLLQWQVPPNGVVMSDTTPREMELLMDRLPRELSVYLQQAYHHRLEKINEIYLQLGLKPKVILSDASTGMTKREYLSHEPCTQGHIDLFANFFQADTDASCNMATAKRKGIAHTLHRVSLVTHPTRNPEKVIGVAVRVGRSLQGLLETMTWESFLLDLANKKQSLLLIGKPGVGKTTVLRQIARMLSEQDHLEVVVVDKTCEIAGDGDLPHPAIGQARWMPVGVPGKQHEIMREAVENQSPDVIIVDEISTPAEVQAARTIAQRGVMLIATVHGRTLPELINCKERGLLMGGVASVTLSGQEAERRFDKRKQVQKRAQEPVFSAALELHGRSKWIYHASIKDAADAYFEGEPCNAQELQPGRAIAVAAIPGEGEFEYCRACGLGRTCSVHIDGHCETPGSDRGRGPGNLTAPNPFSSSSSSQQQRSTPGAAGSFSISGSNGGEAFTIGGGGGRGGGSGGGGGGRRGRRRRAARGSGRCQQCGQPGHYARDCRN
jgi:stage III sporulation protein SpoIIIAA